MTTIVTSTSVVIFILVLFFIIFSNKLDMHVGNSLKMFISGSGFIILGCVILFISSVDAGSRSLPPEDEKKVVADGFTIEGYDILLDVKESCAIDVKENIKVNFYEHGHHGIYRTIPEWLKYTDKDGKTESRRSTISNIGANESIYITGSKDKTTIRLGDSRKTLSRGVHNYEITYTYDMGKDPYDGFDELIFHTIGDYWGTRINNPSVTIKLPKSVELDGKVKVFTDKYRKNDITDKSEITITDNQVVIKPGEDVQLSSALTVDVLLPEDYFVGGSNNYTIASLVLCIICILFAIAAYLMWFFYGKDEKPVSGVEFYPPNEMDPAEVGYVYGIIDNRKLIAALIIRLAGKKAIKINTPSSVTRLISNEEANSVLTMNELTIFNELFKNQESESASLKEFRIYLIIDLIKDNIKEKFKNIVEDATSKIAMVISGIMFAVGTILWAIAYFGVEDLAPSLSALYYIAFVSLLVIAFFTVIMGRSTSKGEKLLAQIESFKNYIDIARIDQIEMLVEENPSYFYDVLPYSYVFNLSNKWVDKFANIEFEKVDFGTLSYGSFDSIGNNLYVTTTQYSSRSSGCSSYTGCSSCGGGSSCSSCGGGGGGCSSCGGGGSW